MANGFIKYLRKKSGEVILPRTSAKAVFYTDGSDVESIITQHSNSIAEHSNSIAEVKLKADNAWTSAEEAGVAANNALNVANGKSDAGHTHTPSSIGASPTSHAVGGTTYGKGTGSLYGHVKLSDSTSSTSAAADGVAASPAAVKSAYDLAKAAMPKSAYTLSGTTLTINW